VTGRAHRPRAGDGDEEAGVPHGSISVGDVQVTALCDVVGDFPAPLGEVFPGVGRAAWEPYRHRYPETFNGADAWRLHDHCYLVRSGRGTILVDTGVGPASAPGAQWIGTPGRLLDELREAGTGPEAVDTVVITHVHLDHVGWNVIWDGDQPRPVFPRARYLVQRADWDVFAAGGDDNDRDAFEHTVRPLETLGVLDLAAGDRPLTGELELLHTPGHTPGSQSVLVSSGGERAVLWGDVANHPAQVTETAWCSRADMDPGLADRTRQALLDRIEAEGMTVSTAHFPEPFGHIVWVEGRRYWRGL
jgi:glyoxylase-like metal-dependent hydrolase (beta-lactamase superfamily II)